MYPLLLSILSLAVLSLLYYYFSKSRQFTIPIITSIIITSVALSVWYTVIEPNRPEITLSASKKAEGKTIEQIIEEIQQKLTQDRNNAELWFQLGQGYFADGKFESASTCFDYAIRLAEDPSATVFAALATSEYYISSQRITDNIQKLIDIALSKDPLNDTALMLVANDHFLSFEYQKAIDIWQKILDSDRANIDRVTLINSINKTKEMIN